MTQAQIAILLPILLSLIGTTTSRILAQSGYSQQVNGVIAWVVVIASAVLCAVIDGKLIGDAYGIMSAVIGFVTLLISGALVSLRPYLIYLDWIETHIFNVIKPIGAEQQQNVSQWRATATDWNKQQPQGGNPGA